VVFSADPESSRNRRDRVGCGPAGAADGPISAVAVDSDQLLHGTQAAGSVGDVILENDRIAIVISAIGHVIGYGLGGGTIIDAALVPERMDALKEVYPYFDDDWPRQAIYTSLEIVEDGIFSIRMQSGYSGS